MTHDGGDVKLFLGDCLEVLETLIKEGVVVDAVIADPPYGTTACKWDSIIPFEPLWEKLNKITKETGAFVLFGSEPFSSTLRFSNIKNYKYDWVWNKTVGTGFLNANKQPLRVTENISVFYRKQCTYNPQKFKGKPCHKRGSKVGSNLTSMNTYGNTKYVETVGDMKFPLNLITFDKVHPSQTVHPTQKPVELMKYLVNTYTNEGDIVLDFCAGSGSTGLACRELNRRFIGIEKEQKYYDIMVKRLEELN